MKWKTQLKHLFEELIKQNNNGFSDKKNSESLSAEEFLINIVKPAFVKLKEELTKYERDCSIDDSNESSISLTVIHKTKEEFNYEIKVRNNNIDQDTVFSVFSHSIERGEKETKGEELTSYPLKDIALVTEENILFDFITGYREHMLK